MGSGSRVWGLGFRVQQPKQATLVPISLRMRMSSSWREQVAFSMEPVYPAMKRLSWFKVWVLECKTSKGLQGLHGGYSVFLGFMV